MIPLKPVSQLYTMGECQQAVYLHTSFINGTSQGDFSILSADNVCRLYDAEHMRDMPVYVSIFLMSLAGMPPTIVFGATSFVTTAPAATTAPSPMVTPASTVALAPIHTFLPI